MKKLIIMLVCMLMISSLLGCDAGKTTSDGEDVVDIDMIKEMPKYIVMENSCVSVVIDKQTGYVETVQNLVTGMVNKNKDQGSWPFYIEYSADGAIIQESSIKKKTNNRVSDIRTYSKDGRSYLELTYDNLVVDGENPEETGIKAVSTFSIGEDQEYFKFNVGLDLTASEGKVMSLHMASGGDLRSGDGADEYLTAPMWGHGTKWANPINNTYFLTGQTVAYPGENNVSLEAGWMDLSGENQGIGIAYINAQELACEFRIESSGSGMSIDIVLFEPIQILGESVPLEAGETFISDDVIISSHSGSWHTLADIYQTEYNAAFTMEDGTPDYLTEDTVSQKADSFYYFLREIGAVGGSQYATLAEMWESVQKDVNELELDYNKLFLWFVGINGNTYGNDTPLLAPYNENLADTGMTFLETYNKYFGTGENSFKAKGGSLFHYGHPFSMALNRTELTDMFTYINPYQHKENWDGGEHWSVCIDNDLVTDFWETTMIPQYKELSADFVQFDQGSLVQTICDMEGHNHDLDAVSRLSSHIQAVNELAKNVKEQLGPDGFILSEGTNDLTCRYIDIRQNSWLSHQPQWGGESEYGTIMYTHPQYVYVNMNFVSDSLGNSSEFYLQSTVLGGIVLLSDSDNNDMKKEAVRFATELRDQGDEIGYPHGYRDTLGMEVSSASIFARVYVQGDNVTVVYMTTSSVENAAIEVDLEELGFEGKGTHTFSIEDMGGYEGGFQTFTVS